jgi:hypothetical protein
VTLKEGGCVQGFGPAATASVGKHHVMTGTASGMINLLDHGPAGDASVGFNGLGYQASITTDTAAHPGIPSCVVRGQVLMCRKHLN